MKSPARICCLEGARLDRTTPTTGRKSSGVDEAREGGTALECVYYF